MAWFPCPYLDGEVELTVEREQHIALEHPGLLPDHRDKIAEVLADPELVRVSTRGTNTRLFSHWYTGLDGGKFVVVVVVSAVRPLGRHWVVTSYIARRLSGGTVEWQRKS